MMMGEFKLKKPIIIEDGDTRDITVSIYESSGVLSHKKKLRFKGPRKFDYVQYSEEDEYNGLKNCLVIVMGEKSIG